MKYIFPILLLLSLTIMSCKKDKEVYTLVYFDFSKSQDTTSIASMRNKVVKLFKHQKKDVKNQFVVRVIDKDYSVQPIFDEVIDGVRDINIRRLIREKEKELDSLGAVISDVINKRVYSNGSGSSMKESCICNSLENAHFSLSHIDTSKCKIQVVIISDMFEECSRKATYFKQDFYMCDGKYGIHKPADELIEMIDSYSPKYPISKYVNPENLYFILSESEGYNQDGRCLLPSEHLEVWRALLIKFGYRGDNISVPNGITISDHLPSRLLNTK